MMNSDTLEFAGTDYEPEEGSLHAKVMGAMFAPPTMPETVETVIKICLQDHEREIRLAIKKLIEDGHIILNEA